MKSQHPSFFLSSFSCSSRFFFFSGMQVWSFSYRSTGCIAATWRVWQLENEEMTGCTKWCLLLRSNSVPLLRRVHTIYQYFLLACVASHVQWIVINWIVVGSLHCPSDGMADHSCKLCSVGSGIVNAENWVEKLQGERGKTREEQMHFQA